MGAFCIICLLKYKLPPKVIKVKACFPTFLAFHLHAKDYLSF